MTIFGHILDQLRAWQVARQTTNWHVKKFNWRRPFFGDQFFSVCSAPSFNLGFERWYLSWNGPPAFFQMKHNTRTAFPHRIVVTSKESKLKTHGSSWNVTVGWGNKCDSMSFVLLFHQVLLHFDHGFPTYLFSSALNCNSYRPSSCS